MTTPDASPRRLPLPLDAALRPFQRLGVRPRLLLALTFLALFGVGVATVFHLSALADFTVSSMVLDAQQITQQATLIVDKTLSAKGVKNPEDAIRNDKNLKTFLNASIGPYPYVQYIAVVDRKGIVLASTTQTFVGDTLEAAPQAAELIELGALAKLAALQQNRDYELVQPIERAGRRVGAIRVGMASSFVRNGLVTPFKRSLALALAAMVLAVMLAFVLADLTTRPLHALLGAIERLTQGDYAHRLEPVEADHDLGRLFASFNTMTERLAEDRTVIESRNRNLQTLVDGLEDGVLMVEKDGRIAHANPIVCRVLRRTEEQLVDQDVAQALGATHPLTELWREALAQSGTRERSDVRLDSDARGDHYLLLAYPVPQGRDPQGVVLTLRNSDSLRKLTSLLDESHRMIAWGQVALGVAHEIKNPLQAMNLNLELAREKIIRDTEGLDMTGPLRNLGVVGQQIHRLDEVVNAFLRFARMTHAQREPLPINGIVSEVVGLVTSEAEKQGTEIRFTPRPGLPTPYGDRGMIYQVFLNLVQNAVQAGPHKGPIDVRIEEGANRGLSIEVQDRGKGIKKSDQARVFDLFYTTRESGSGIGLAIVQRALQLHGGQVSIESEEGKGTTVKAWLPLNVPLDSPPGGAQLVGAGTGGAMRARA
jgi:signal transduction histidine kinase/HAMP domain-containing protein